MIHAITIGSMLFTFTVVISPEFRYILIFSLTELVLKMERIIEDEERRSKR
jgi:hypothetical protein